MTAASELPDFPLNIDAGWIDFNGHVRDAYYLLAASYATDAALQHLGVGSDYRQRTGCTLYTVELHIRYLHEVTLQDRLTIATSVLDFDRQRIHLGCRFMCEGRNTAAAAAEFMLVHVRQGAIPFVKYLPDAAAAQLSALKSTCASELRFTPRSRKILIPPA